MSFLSILLTVIVVGILLWAVNSFLPLEGTVMKIFNAIIIIALLGWLLHVFGLWNYIERIRP